MEMKIGIWLDRTNAIIVRIGENSYETSIVNSAIESARHPRCGTEGHCTIIPEKKLKQRKLEITKKYYQAIIKNIYDASELFVLGPGMAKNELIDEIKNIKNFKPKIIGVASADKMSIRQLQSEMRAVFNPAKQQQKNNSLLFAFNT